MRKHIFIFLFTIVTVALVAGSCTSRRIVQIKSPTTKFGNYLIAEIPDFKSKVPKIPTELKWQLANKLANELKAKNVFVGVSRAPINSSENILILDATITRVDPPEWYKQVIKAGEIGVNVRFIDKDKTTTIASANFSAIYRAGVISGGMILADRIIINEIVNYIKDNT